VTGEENGHTGPDDAERTWLVDPLCGTLNYAARTKLVAVNVPLGEGSGITAAAAVDPFSGEVFWTDGRRACVRRGDADTKLSPSADSRLVDVNLDPPFPNAPAFRAVSPSAGEPPTSPTATWATASTAALLEMIAEPSRRPAD
jgi:myo-inositol-1(or 4)-monophosphatase